MSGLLFPVLLIVAGLAAAAATYRGIRRGGARFYTLERELILRRAATTLAIAVLFFLGAVALLFYQRQQLLEQLNPVVVEESAAEEGEGEILAPVPTTFVEQFPPTETPTSTVPEATEEPTVELCRAAVEGTGGNGLTMRDAPQGAQVVVLPEGTLLTVLDSEPTESGGINWRLVRAVGGEEGWVAEDFLTIRGLCGGEGEP